MAFALRVAVGLIGFVLAVITGNSWWAWGLGGAALIAMAIGLAEARSLVV